MGPVEDLAMETGARSGISILNDGKAPVEAGELLSTINRAVQIADGTR